MVPTVPLPGGARRPRSVQICPNKYRGDASITPVRLLTTNYNVTTSSSSRGLLLVMTRLRQVMDQVFVRELFIRVFAVERLVETYLL